MNPIYLDSHATTPVDPRVLDAMLPFFTEHFGNASSRNHPFGWKAGKAVERAREQVAALIGAKVREVVFTSGATESNNLAIKGVAARAPEYRRHIVTVVDRAPSGARSVPRARASGISRDVPAGQRERSNGPRAS